MKRGALSPSFRVEGANQVPLERILLSVILCAVGVPVYFITKVVNKKQAEAGPKAE